MWRVSVPTEKLVEFVMADTRQDAGVGDLVAVEVEDRQNNPVAHRIQELIGMPARRERAGLRLTVSDDTGRDQIAVVEGSSVCVR